MVDRYITLKEFERSVITRAGYPIARIEPQGRMKRVTLLDGTFYTVCSKGRYMASGKHPCDVITLKEFERSVITHPDHRWYIRLYRAFF